MVEYVNRHRLDREVIGLVLALNSFKGIHTFESCCGHAEGPFWIVFQADSFEDLACVLWWFRDGHELHEYRNWHITVSTDPDAETIYFQLDGPTGERAYEEANALATLILNRADSGHKMWVRPLWVQLSGREK